MLLFDLSKLVATLFVAEIPTWPILEVVHATPAYT